MNHPATHRFSPRSANRFLALAAAVATPLIAALWAPSTAFGQAAVPTRPATIPSLPAPKADPAATVLIPLKSVASLSPQQVQVVQQYVAGKMVPLNFPDASTSRDARFALEAGATSGKQPASPAYQAAYAAALSTTLSKVLDGPEARARVSAAIILAQVAARTSQPALAPAVQKALADRSQGVVMWGLRAARHVYPAMLDVPTGQPQAEAFAGSVITALLAYADSPEMTEDAFDAIAGDLVLAPGQPGAGANRAKRALIPLIQLVQARATAYAKVNPAAAAGFPAVPGIETRQPYPNLFVVLYRSWPDIKPTDRPSAFRALHDLAAELTRVGPAMPAGGAVAPKVLLDQLAVVAGTIKGMAALAQAKGVDDAATQLRKDAQQNGAGLATSMAALTAELEKAKLLGPPLMPTAPGTAPAAAGHR